MTDDPAPLGTINGRYELQEIVGSGGMGVVYRAHDRVLSRSVAVKVIREELVNDEFIRRFEREAAMLARVRSPHIVVVFDYGSTDGRFFQVTDFLPDGDLADWLEEHGPMPPEQAVPLVAAVADALADAHQQGVVHRDVKPGNVLLWRRGDGLHPVLADFGVAVTADLAITGTGFIVGSPPFMAPERHLGEPATEATDIYAVGCLLFNVLTGTAPFPGTHFQMAHAHINSPPPTLPEGVSGARRLDRVIATCLAKDPADRYPSAAAVAEALRTLGPSAHDAAAADDHLPERPPAASTVVAPAVVGDTRADDASPTLVRRRRAPLVAGAVAVALLLAGVAIAGWGWLADDDITPTGSADPSASAPTPPSRPGQVAAETTPGNRSVEFRVDLPPPDPGVATTVELKDEDGDWRPTDTGFVLPTTEGREAKCAVLRLVNTEGDQRATGTPRRVCGRAAPPRIVPRAVPGSTCAILVSGQSIPCDWVNVVIQGFRSEQSLTLHWRFAPPAPPVVATFPLTAGADGTAAVAAHRTKEPDPTGLCPDQRCPGGFPAPRGTDGVTIWVTDDAGKVLVKESFDLDGLR